MAELNTYKSNYTVKEIEQMVKFYTESVAGIFNTSTSYVVDDFVIYDGFLYQCITPTTGEWDSTKWQIQKIFDNEGKVILKGGNAPH